MTAPADSELRAAAARRARYDAAVEALAESERRLEQARLLAARWRREVGELAEQLDAGAGALQRLRRFFGGGRQARAGLEAQLAAARSRHDEADAEVPSLERARDEARDAARDLEDAPAAFAELLAAKEIELRARGGELAEHLQRSSDALFALEEERELVADLVLLGRDAEGELLAGKQSLQQARHAAGGDVIGGAVGARRAPALREAERYLQAAGAKLEQMGNTLRERAAVMRRITLPAGKQLEDMLFEALPSDLLERRRIQRATEEVSATVDQLRSALWSAEAFLEQLEQRARVASDERAAWIVAAQ